MLPGADWVVAAAIGALVAGLQPVIRPPSAGQGARLAELETADTEESAHKQ